MRVIAQRGMVTACCLISTSITSLSQVPLWTGKPDAHSAAGAKEPPYFDSHGNACPEVQELMLARFGFTESVCAAIDSLGQHEPRRREALYWVLGFVKDPRTIPWLKSKLDAGDELMYRYWLRCWPLSVLPDPILSEGYWRAQPWLEEPDVWSRFFIDWARRETAPDRRLKILRRLATNFDSEETIAFFVKLEMQCELDSEELLLAQTYLFQHGRRINSGKLALAGLELLFKRPERLLSYARGLRHEVMVPLLLLGASNDEAGNVAEVEDALRRITFAGDVCGLEAWRAWYNQHSDRPRSQWSEDAMRGVAQLLDKNPREAKRVLLARSKYFCGWPYWADPGILSHVAGFAERKELHPVIAEWITYSYHPYWRKEYEPLVDKIVRESLDRIEEPVLERLRIQGLVADSRATWPQYVKWFNSRR